MHATHIHGWTVTLFADLDDGGNVNGYTAAQIEAMNAYLESELGEDLVYAETEDQAAELIAAASRQALALAEAA